MQRDETRAKWNVVLAMAVFGTIGAFVRFIPLSSGEISLYRALIAIVTLLIWRRATRSNIWRPNLRKNLLPLFLSGAAMGVNWILLFEAYRYTTVSMATLAYYFAPTLVALFSPLLFHEKLTKRNVFCFVMSTLGLILITDASADSGGSHHIGILLGLGAAVFYAFVVIVNKSLKDVPNIDRTLCQFVAAALTVLPYTVLTSGLHLAAAGGRGLLLLLIVGVFHTGLMYCLYFSSLSRIAGHEVAILSYVDPLVAVLVSALFLKEPITFLQIVGSVIILGFTLLNELSPKPKTT